MRGLRWATTTGTVEDATSSPVERKSIWFILIRTPETVGFIFPESIEQALGDCWQTTETPTEWPWPIHLTPQASVLAFENFPLGHRHCHCLDPISKNQSQHTSSNILQVHSFQVPHRLETKSLSLGKACLQILHYGKIPDDAPNIPGREVLVTVTVKPWVDGSAKSQ